VNAWLVTWEGTEHRKQLDRVAAIMGSRRSEGAVAEYVEMLYLRAMCDAQDMAYYANRPGKFPYRAQKGLLINQVPHGDHVLCGHNPWLYARKVSKLEVRRDGKFEVLSWQEPPTIRWKGDSRVEFDAWTPGKPGSCRRLAERPLSEDIWRWRK
jgi:hypothetical protein